MRQTERRSDTVICQGDMVVTWTRGIALDIKIGKVDILNT